MKTRLVLAICGLAAAYAAGTQALPTDNLLANPGFEATPGLAGWTSSNAGLRSNDPAPHGGQNYVDGPYTPVFSVSQEVDLIAAGLQTTDIDTGSLGLDFGGWQSGWRGQDDYGQIVVSLLDATNTEIGSASLSNQGAVSASTWVEQSGSTSLLADTRFIRYTFTGTRVEGSNDDAYLDDAYLNITGSVTPPPAPVPEPSALWLFVLGLAGAGMARWRLARR